MEAEARSVLRSKDFNQALPLDDYYTESVCSVGLVAVGLPRA